MKMTATPGCFRCVIRTVVLLLILGHASPYAESSDVEEWGPPGDFVQRVVLVNEIQKLAFVVFVYGPYPVSRNSLSKSSDVIESLLTEIEARLDSTDLEEAAVFYYATVVQDLRRALAINYYRISILDSESGNHLKAGKSRERALQFLDGAGTTWEEQELRMFVLANRKNQQGKCCDLCEALASGQ